MPACILCGENTFEEFDGNFFCNNCGTETQELRNEVDVEADTENLIPGSSQQRQIIAKRTRSKRRSKYPDTDFGKPWLTYEAIQCLLKAQIKALVDLGVNPALKDVICQIWFRFLNKRRVAFTGAREGSFIALSGRKMRKHICMGEERTPSVKAKLELTAEKERSSYGSVEDDSSYSYSGSDTNESDESDYIEQEHIGSIRYKHEESKHNWTVMQHRHTVVFLYMGILYLKETVTVADILRLIAKGHIPYYKLSKVLPSHMKFSKEDLGTFPYRSLTVNKIHEGTKFLINYLDLPIVPVPDMFLLIAKLILDFQFPSAIHRLALSLLKASEYQPCINFMHRRRVKCNEYYEEMAAAFVIVALKLVYRLDGEAERNGNIPTKYLDVAISEVDCWYCMMLRLEKKKQYDVLFYNPKCESDLSYVNDCKDYAMYCTEEIFRGATGQLASRTHLNSTRVQSKACMNDAKEEYYGIMSEAVRELENGKEKEFRKLSSTSFVYDHISKEESTDISCKCRKKRQDTVTQRGSESDDGIDVVVPDNDSYLVYLNDLSGLKVHDCYGFLLDVVSRRLNIKSVELQEFVAYVETMLFVD